jgi:hypothetical protein
VSVLGLDPRRDRAALREVLGIQLQASVLPDKLRVREAVALFASFYPVPADPDELIERWGLAGRRDTPFAKLSGGQKQRRSIVLALVGNPRVAILDELTTGLDPQARRDTWDAIEQIRAAGVTVVLVTLVQQWLLHRHPAAAPALLPAPLLPAPLLPAPLPPAPLPPAPVPDPPARARAARTRPRRHASGHRPSRKRR